MQILRMWCWRISCILLVMVTLTGCPKKTPPPSETSLESGGSGSSGLGEKNLSAGLSSEARDTLQTNAGWLRSNAQVKVEIEGHCDERGTVEYNLALGAKRAKAARDYLVTLGVSANQISTISYGEELPVCKEST